MSVTEAPSTSPTTRCLRSVGVLLVFALVGPALGGVLVFCALFPVAMLFGFNPATVPTDEGTPGLAGVFGMLTLFVAMGYAFGGAQAVLTGLWASISTWRKGAISSWGTVLAAVLATLAWIAILYSPLNPLDAVEAGSDRKLSNALQIALAITPIGIICALFCRWLARRVGLSR